MLYPEDTMYNLFLVYISFDILLLLREIAIDKCLSIAILTWNRYWQTFVTSAFQKINQVIYLSSPIKPLAQIIFEISCWHNSRQGDNSDKKKKKKKKYRSAIFHEESIYEISNPSVHGS